MQILFKAMSAPTTYEIDGEQINGIDLAALEHGDQFIGNDDTRDAGIRHAERDSQGELWVTLQQAPPVTRISFKVEGRKRPITLRPEQVEREGDELVLRDTEEQHATDDDGNLLYVTKEGEPTTDNTGTPLIEAVEVVTRWTILRAIEHRGGDWTESDWIDAANYDPDTLYIKEVQS